jgi:hypothetical protein
MFTYAIVERALARAFAITPESMGAFRGRIQHFQRLGMVPASPGKGRKISYEIDHVYKWALGLEFAEFGIDPRLTKFIIENFVWIRARKFLLDDDGKNKLLVFYPNLISGWGQYEEKRIVGGLVFDFVDSLSELEKKREKSKGQNVHFELLSRRLGMIDLGRLRRAVEDGLNSD